MPEDNDWAAQEREFDQAGELALDVPDISMPLLAVAIAAAGIAVITWWIAQ